MADVFISYVEEDGALAERLAAAIEASGLCAWYYERDSVPGPKYLDQIAQVIKECRVVLVLVSAASLGAHQVGSEIEHAFEVSRPFVPVLLNVSQAEFQKRQPGWQQTFGDSASIRLGLDEERDFTRIVTGIKSLLTGTSTQVPPSMAPRATIYPRPEGGQPVPKIKQTTTYGVNAGKQEKYHVSVTFVTHIVLSVLFLICLLLTNLDFSDETGKEIVLVAFSSVVMEGIFSCIFYQDAWYVLEKGNTRTQRTHFVFLLFVPVFNIYWSYKIIYDLYAAYERYANTNYFVNKVSLNEFHYKANGLTASFFLVTLYGAILVAVFSEYTKIDLNDVCVSFVGLGILAVIINIIFGSFVILQTDKAIASIRSAWVAAR